MGFLSEQMSESLNLAPSLGLIFPLAWHVQLQCDGLCFILLYFIL